MAIEIDPPLYTRTCPPLFFEPTPPGTTPGHGRIPGSDELTLLSIERRLAEFTASKKQEKAQEEYANRVHCEALTTPRNRTKQHREIGRK